MKRSALIVLAFILAVTAMAGCTRQAPSREGEAEATPTTDPDLATVVAPEGGATVVTTGPSPTPVVVEPTADAESTVVTGPTEAPTTEPPTTVPPTATSAPAASPGCRWNHVVQRGEWVWQIARNYGVSPYAILKANGMTIQSANIIQPGTVLCIP
jgi:LysM repeat protein